MGEGTGGAQELTRQKSDAVFSAEGNFHHTCVWLCVCTRVFTISLLHSTSENEPTVMHACLNELTPSTVSMLTVADLFTHVIFHFFGVFSVEKNSLKYGFTLTHSFAWDFYFYFLWFMFCMLLVLMKVMFHFWFVQKTAILLFENCVMGLIF